MQIRNKKELLFLLVLIGVQGWCYGSLVEFEANIETNDYPSLYVYAEYMGTEGDKTKDGLIVYAKAGERGYVAEDNNNAILDNKKIDVVPNVLEEKVEYQKFLNIKLNEKLIEAQNQSRDDQAEFRKKATDWYVKSIKPGKRGFFQNIIFGTKWLAGLAGFGVVLPIITNPATLVPGTMFWATCYFGGGALREKFDTKKYLEKLYEKSIGTFEKEARKKYAKECTEGTKFDDLEEKVKKILIEDTSENSWRHQIIDRTISLIKFVTTFALPAYVSNRLLVQYKVKQYTDLRKWFMLHYIRPVKIIVSDVFLSLSNGTKSPDGKFLVRTY